jgi:hypothetical protein
VKPSGREPPGARRLSLEPQEKRTMSESSKMGAFVVAIAAAPLLGLACSTTELVPLVPSEDGVAVVQEAQLELKAEVQPGENSVPNTLTPIKISLKNLAPESVHVALDDIELELVENGKTSEAVPPQRIKPRPPIGLGVDPASPFASQTATSSASVNPPAAAIAPDPNTTYQADAAHGKDVTTDPVRREIIATAFTGGEIASGATEEGLVYFATPPKHIERLRLIVRVRARQGQNPPATIEIPYAVKS